MFFKRIGIGKLRVLAVGLLCFFGSSQSFAQEQQNTSVRNKEKGGLTIRPHSGYGLSVEGKGYFHFGGRALLSLEGGVRGFALELTKFSGEHGFVVAGLVLEQKLFGWFKMSVGTVGYFNYGDNNSDNVAGLTTNLGWEPSNRKTIAPFITYRSDWVFHNPFDHIHSISVGLSFKL